MPLIVGCHDQTILLNDWVYSPRLLLDERWTLEPPQRQAAEDQLHADEYNWLRRANVSGMRSLDFARDAGSARRRREWNHSGEPPV
jgi:hypothetical protein